MGGELFLRMVETRRLDEPAAVFYGACVASALGYLQSHHVRG